MAGRLHGRKMAVLATDGVEQVELLEPAKALKRNGVQVEIVSNKAKEIQGFNHIEKGYKIRVDRTLGEAKSDDYDALMLPGGVINPAMLRLDPTAIDFVRSGKPVAAICHGPWTLIDAGGVKGKKMTSWPSLRTDLSHAGAHWRDESVVTDNGLVTSRKPDDIPAFVHKMIEEFAEGRHSATT